MVESLKSVNIELALAITRQYSEVPEAKQNYKTNEWYSVIYLLMVHTNCKIAKNCRQKCTSRKAFSKGFFPAYLFSLISTVSVLFFCLCPSLGAIKVV